MFSKHSQLKKSLSISMPVSHLYQNLEIAKGVRSLKWASEGVNYCDKRAHLFRDEGAYQLSPI